MKARNTKQALLLSILALFLSMASLVGTTAAWFYDSASSTGNVIKTGKLDIALEKWDADSQKWINAENTEIFDSSTPWQPGHMEIINLRVVNTGTLAYKWQATVNAAGLSDVADYITVYVKSDDENDTVREYIEGFTDASAFEALANTDPPTVKKFTLREFIDKLTLMTKGVMVPDQESYLGIVLYMHDNIPSHLQGKNLFNSLKLTVVATQLEHESDSFDTGYDAGVEYPDTDSGNTVNVDDNTSETTATETTAAEDTTATEDTTAAADTTDATDTTDTTATTDDSSAADTTAAETTEAETAEQQQSEL